MSPERNQEQSFENSLENFRNHFIGAISDASVGQKDQIEKPIPQVKEEFSNLFQKILKEGRVDDELLHETLNDIEDEKVQSLLIYGSLYFAFKEGALEDIDYEAEIGSVFDDLPPPGLIPFTARLHRKHLAAQSTSETSQK
jgi:hypothetical protein